MVRRRYRTVSALDGVSFEIEPEELVGYIGPNGAGKSTTVKVISGILLPDFGRCEILGRVPWKERVAHVRNIGVVFGQRTQLWWDLPVIESFELLRDIYKVPASGLWPHAGRGCAGDGTWSRCSTCPCGSSAWASGCGATSPPRCCTSPRASSWMSCLYS